MPEVVLALLAIVVGALFCFRGQVLLRVVLAIWGAFVGFNLGAALVASIAGTGFLATATGWVVALVLAVLFSVLAYAYYAVAVILATVAAGFALGSAGLVALGVEWSWLVVLGGVALGVLLGLWALLGQLPMLLLAVLSSLAGAAVMVGGIVLLLDPDGAALLGSSPPVQAQEWWWSVLFVVLAIAGLVSQLRDADARQRAVREDWARARQPVPR